MSNHYNDYDSGQFMLNWDTFFESTNLEDDCICNILLTNRVDVIFCSLFLLGFFGFFLVWDRCYSGMRLWIGSKLSDLFSTLI